MRDDNDLARSPQDHDLSSKYIGDKDNHLESETMKIEVSEKKKTFISLGDYLKREKDSQLPEHGEAPDVYKDMNLDDSIGEQCDREQKTDVTALSSTMMPTARREAEFYMDKSVTEIEQPKMIVCFQNDAYHVVKDICVDDGVHSCNKVSQQNDNFDHRKVYIVSQSMGDKCDIPDNDKSAFDCSDPLYVYGNPFLDIDNKSASPGSIDTKTDGQKVDKLMDQVSCEKVTNDHLQQEFEHNNSQTDFLKSVSNSEELKLSEIDNTPKNDCSDGQEKQDSPRASNETSVAPNCCVDEYNESEIPTSAPLNSTTSDGKLFNSEVKETTKLTEGAIEPHLVEHAKVGLISGQHSADSFNSLPQSSVVHCGHNESIMHGPGCLSDRISHTGPMAYSGSVSIRSDSSTTSTRSFAFPILQSEWNSSPVRMAKPDRKLYRKHRGWRAGVWCCRF